MRFRWKLKELQEIEDFDFLDKICIERQSDCTNINSPLFKKLAEVRARLHIRIEEQKRKDEEEKGDNLHVEICSHDISYYLRDGKIGMTIDEMGIEHIKDCLNAGYIGGDLCVSNNEVGEEYYGYWHIER